MRRLAPFVALSFLYVACNDNSRAPRGDSVSKTAAPLSVPNGDPILDFYEDAADSRDIALTFDDGPDEVGYTNKVLDVLRAKGVKATFFVNTDNAIDVNASSFARNTLERVVAEGHELASHSVHHYDLGSTSTNVWAEISNARSTLRAVVPSSLSVRLFRAPFGNPYFGPQSRLDYVSPLVARDGVHVGWNIDSLDWQCEEESSAPQTCILNNVLNDVDAGRSGIVLLHSIHPSTANVLSKLIDSLTSRGKRFIGVEELVVAKYGKGSRYLLHCKANTDCSPGDSCGTDARCHADGTPPPPPPPPPTTSGGWTKLPEFPLTARGGNAFAWIGGEAVVWGGLTDKGTYLASGSAYDPTRGTWRSLPAAPLSARAKVTFASSDRAMFVFGGENNDYVRMSSGMVYDAWTNAWTRLPNAPHTMRCGAGAVWAESTGEFVVYGCEWDSTLSKYRVSGLALNLATRTYRQIAAAPLTAREGFALAWAGGKMIVWGGADEKSSGPNGIARADGAAYDPATDTWTLLPTAPLAARYGASVATDGAKVFILGGYAQGAASAFADGAMYDASTGTWTALPALTQTIVGAATWTDGTKLWAWGGRQGGALANVGFSYDVATQTWSTLPASPLSAASGANAAWTGSTGVVFGGRLASTTTDSAAIYTP